MEISDEWEMERIWVFCVCGSRYLECVCGEVFYICYVNDAKRGLKRRGKSAKMRETCFQKQGDIRWLNHCVWARKMLTEIVGQQQLGNPLPPCVLCPFCSVISHPESELLPILSISSYRNHIRYYPVLSFQIGLHFLTNSQKGPQNINFSENNKFCNTILYKHDFFSEMK